LHDCLQYLDPGRVLLGTKLQLGGHNIKLLASPAAGKRLPGWLRISVGKGAELIAFVVYFDINNYVK
jgi:hypothetical protein